VRLGDLYGVSKFLRKVIVGVILTFMTTFHQHFNHQFLLKGDIFLPLGYVILPLGGTDD